MDERIDDSVLRWLGHIKRIENGLAAKRVYEGECVRNFPVG